MKAYLSVMVSKNSYFMIVMLALLASCAPIEQPKIEVSAPAPSIKDKPQQETLLADNETIIDNATDEIVAADNADDKLKTEEQAVDNAKAADEDEPKTERKIVLVLPDPPPPPKPIEPLNPAIFTGLQLEKLEKRLGRPDRQFNEQALDVWHYEEPHCHALFFIRNSGDSAQIMHVDLRANLLDSVLDRQTCYADFGQRAEALLNQDKR